MLKTTLKTLTALAVMTVLAQSAGAEPQATADAAASAGVVRLAYSPAPQRALADPLLLMVRDVRQAGGGGGCWSHCFNNYNECVGLKEKNMCVTSMKTCMETCDRLSGLSNPREQQQQQR
jgi:hypothetical protein